MVEYDDPRKCAFLADIPVKYRGDVGNLFARPVRAGERDRALIARDVWIRVGEREDDARRSGYGLGPGTIPAADLRAVMVADRDRTLAYAEYVIEWESMTPQEKAAAKAPTKASYLTRYYRAQDGGAR